MLTDEITRERAKFRPHKWIGSIRDRRGVYRFVAKVDVPSLQGRRGKANIVGFFESRDERQSTVVAPDMLTARFRLEPLEWVRRFTPPQMVALARPVAWPPTV